MSRRLELPIGPELAGIKVDTLLKRRLGLSGTVVRRIKWLEDGILVDGRRVNTRYIPKAGEVLSVRLSDPERRSGIVPAPGPLDIVYEDQDLLVLNKAPGVAVHPGPGHFDDTIGNFLLNYYDQEGEEGDFHPVHRLDRGTSGLLVVARHPHVSFTRPTFSGPTWQSASEHPPRPPAPLTRLWGLVRDRWWNRRSGRTGNTPVLTMRPCGKTVPLPCSGSSWRPGGLTRSGSTCPIWATPWWETFSTEQNPG